MSRLAEGVPLFLVVVVVRLPVLCCGGWVVRLDLAGLDSKKCEDERATAVEASASWPIPFSLPQARDRSSHHTTPQRPRPRPLSESCSCATWGKTSSWWCFQSFRAASAPINVEIELCCCRENSLTQVRPNTHHYTTQYVSSRRRPFPFHPRPRVAVGVAQDFTRQRLPPREGKALLGHEAASIALPQGRAR